MWCGDPLGPIIIVGTHSYRESTVSRYPSMRYSPKLYFSLVLSILSYNFDYYELHDVQLYSIV